MQTPVQAAFLQVVMEIYQADFDRRRLTARAFAARAGLSRQALHKSHPEIVLALHLMYSALAPPSRTDEEIGRRLKEAERELKEKKDQLSGSSRQNLDLIVQVEELRLQLKKKGLTLVPRRSANDW
ncbi:hypothetical protein bAD24_III12000 [Burkholderia sp. AD24]|jgi:hypothetical protein|nr:hypothetical protein bAD24_III12000 [Burkholderia sp. AD24]